MKEFFVSVNNEQQGPFTLQKVVEMMSTGKISATDYIYCEDTSDWVLMLEHKELSSFLKKAKPKAPPKQKEPAAVTQVKAKAKFKEIPSNPMLTEWYLLKGENKFGPFGYTDVIKMLQEKVVFEFDFAWKNGMEAWVRIAELQEFAPEHVKKLQESLMPEIKENFFRRKHPRIEYKGRVVAHNNEDIWKGQGVEVSVGGAGMLLSNSMLIPGQTVSIHFKADENVPAFNAICEIVSKKFVDGLKEKSTSIFYGVKFKNVSGNAIEALAECAKRSGKSAA